MWTLFFSAWFATAGPDTTHWLAGADVPEVSLQTFSGEPTTAPWAGREEVVVLWAGWCGPCVSELPVLAVAMGRAGASGRAVTLVSIDEEPKVARRALKRLGRDVPTWTSVWGGPEAAGRFGTRTLPTTFVLTAEGRVDSVWTGHQDLGAWAEILGGPPGGAAAPQ